MALARPARRITGQRTPSNDTNAVCITGDLATARRWAVLSRIGRGTVAIVGLTLLAVAVLPLVFGMFEDADLPWWANRALYELLRARRGMAWLMTERWPELGKAVHYDPGAFVDWHLLAAGIAINALRRPLGDALARVAGSIVRPLLYRRVGVRITPQRIEVSGFSRPISIPRSVTEGITFRVQRLQPHLAGPERPHRGPIMFPSWYQQPAFLEVHQGVKLPHRIYILRASEGEAFASWCNEVLSKTTRRMPEDIT